MYRIIKANLVDQLEWCEQLNKTWESWIAAHKLLNKLVLNERDIQDVSTLTRAFGNAYVDAFGEPKVTPYIHLVVCHLPALVNRLKTMHVASQEKFELFHRTHKTIFYRTTTRGGCFRHGIQDTLANIYIRKINLVDWGTYHNAFSSWLDKRRALLLSRFTALFSSYDFTGTS